MNGATCLHVCRDELGSPKSQLREGGDRETSLLPAKEGRRRLSALRISSKEGNSSPIEVWLFEVPLTNPPYSEYETRRGT